MRIIPYLETPKTGEFQVKTKTNAYYVRTLRGRIVDCAPILRESYLDVHVKYLLSFLRKTQGEVEVNLTVR